MSTFYFLSKKREGFCLNRKSETWFPLNDSTIRLPIVMRFPLLLNEIF